MTLKFTERAGAASVDCEIDDDFLMGEFYDFAVDTREAALAVGDSWAGEVVDWMKQNHKWENRTERAEKSLGVLPEHGSNEGVWRFTAGVPYMRHLELWFSGRFSVLGPAVDMWAPVLEERLGAERE